MATRLAPAVSLLMAACSAPAPVPKSLCDLPRNMGGWSGYDVRWHGLIVVSGHGAAFIAQDCRRRGLAITDLSKEAGTIFLSITRKAPLTGWFEIDLTGKIAGHGLYVATIHRLDPIEAQDGERRAKRLGF